MKNITGKSVVCGVIGNPIHHTLSPLIHETIASYLGHDLAYVPFLVEDNLKAAIKGAHALHIKGLNVTMPHKQEVMNSVVEMDEMAIKVGAVNTLVRMPLGYKGYNTDAMGLRYALEQNGLDYKGENVAIIGSGGAAYAAVVSVVDKAKSIHVFNRTKANAESLKMHFKEDYQSKIEVYGDTDKPKVDIDYVIQTTGVGMGRLENQMPVCTHTLLEKAQIAVDLIYNPEETLFLKEAKARGCRVMNGFDMLFYQATIAYELMHECTIEQAQAKEIRELLLQKIG